MSNTFYKLKIHILITDKIHWICNAHQFSDGDNVFYILNIYLYYSYRCTYKATILLTA
uniref:Uncharacterized protein n=1 Tax=Anguilla anguilla TaxID=7936 RepID=A0A0E9UF87_ANGAN